VINTKCVFFTGGGNKKEPNVILSTSAF